MHSEWEGGFAALSKYSLTPVYFPPDLHADSFKQYFPVHEFWGARVDANDTKLAFGLIDAAYLAGSGNSSWDQFTSEFGRAFPDLLTVLAGYDQRVSGAQIFASANIEDWAIKAYHDHYHKVNVYLEKANQWKTLPNVTYWHETLTKDEILSSEFYRDFISKQGPCFEAFAGVIFREQSRFLALTCNYGEQQRQSAHRAASLLHILGPHLQRAFELHRQLEGERIQKYALEASFNHINAAVLVIGRGKKIHFANRRAEQMLHAETVIKSANKTLSFVSTHDQDCVFAEIALLSSYAPARKPQLVALQAPRDNPHLAFVSVLVDEQRAAGLSAKQRQLLPHRMLLFLIDPAEQTQIGEDMIMATLNCSPAEARLAQSLMMGCDLRRHSDKSGSSYNTARAQLQSLFAKTGMNSQAALVGRLARVFSFLG